MDILIVGGNGFIGSNLEAYLLSRDPSVNILNLDVARNTRMEDIMGLNEYQGRYTFKEGSICDLATYEHYLKVSDLVINCSSTKQGHHFKEGMEGHIRTNILGARVLADSVCRNRVPLLHISSAEVYGSCPFTIHRREESDPLDPTNSFATTIAAGERLAYIAGKRSGVPMVIVRPCELLGPNQSAYNIVPRTIRSILSMKPPQIREKGGDRYRDWLHILDLCSALRLIMDSLAGSSRPIASGPENNVHSHPGATVISGTSIGTASPSPPEGSTSKTILSGVSIFNITSEMRFTITEIVEKTMEIMGSDLPLQESSEEGYKDIGYNPSGKKISYHGWQAKYNDIDDILRSTVEWYKENPDVLRAASSGRLMP